MAIAIMKNGDHVNHGINKYMVSAYENLSDLAATIGSTAYALQEQKTYILTPSNEWVEYNEGGSGGGGGGTTVTMSDNSAGGVNLTVAGLTRVLAKEADMPIYTAGTGITIENNVISINLSNGAEVLF